MVINKLFFGSFVTLIIVLNGTHNRLYGHPANMCFHALKYGQMCWHVLACAKWHHFKSLNKISLIV